MSTSSSASASATASATATGTPQLPSSFKIVGVLLAIISGALIGSSFVFKKKGLLRSQGANLGEGVAYLKSPMWWTGMIMMILGEICNFAAYAFVPAIVVTPLGALSVVICAILSSIFLKETLTFFGWVGCSLCIVGSIIIALNGPQEATVGHIKDFQKLFLAPGFLVFGGGLIVISIVIVVYFIPRYGKTNMLWCIMVCSMIGGLSVSTTTGLGAAIVTSIYLHDNQFKNVFIYILLVFVTVTLLTEVYYLNMALALFNTAMVTPTYYVIFTGFTLITTVVLYKGLHASAAQILTVVMGFLVICAGITILQMSKVDPTQLNKLDRRSTILLQAARKNTENTEKSISGTEDPGMDALRGSFGTVGSIIRARSARRMSQASRDATRPRHGFPGGTPDPQGAPEHMLRHQLYDTPMPRRNESTIGSDASDMSREQISLRSGPPRTPTIKFGDQDVAHYYHGPGEPAGARHEVLASHGSARVGSQLPPRLPSPLGIDLERGAFTAPAGQGSFNSEQVPDPFETSPASATGAGFPPMTYDDEPPRGKHPHRYQSSSGRNYPKTAGIDDRDESVSLVQTPSDTAHDHESESDADLDGPPRGGIRLLSSTSRI
ncbi:magnesium transporter NIPA-domain-containing protein [Gautieria morchelliformis]|nr:magnesium transporter NIPA-domain-containing protein [Gautieria morchelliformis]